MATKYRVQIGTPARKRSAIVTAADENDAVTQAVEALVAKGEDREWIEQHAANRDRKFGTCYVERWA